MKKWRLVILAVCCLLLISSNAFGHALGEELVIEHPFSGSLPEPLVPLFEASEWEGYSPVSGAYSTRGSAYEHAVVLLEKEGRFRLCVFCHDGKEWFIEADTEKALLQDKQFVLVPDFSNGQCFRVVYESGDGTVETYSFEKEEDWYFTNYIREKQGIVETTIYASWYDWDTIQVNGITCGNTQSTWLQDFDAAAFPRTWEEVVARGGVDPEERYDIGLIWWWNQDDNGIPPVPMYDAPSYEATVQMRYFPGVQAQVLDTTNEFTHVQIGNVQGYISREAFAIGSEMEGAHFWYGQTSLTRAQMPESTLSLLESPSRDAAILGQVETEHYVVILGISADNQWLQVAIPKVNAESAGLSDGPEQALMTGFLPITEAIEVAYLQAAVVRCSKPDERLTLYASPSKTAESLGEYYSGVRVQFLHDSERVDPWQRVIIEGVAGYVDSCLDYSSEKEAEYLPPVATVQGADQGLTLRTGPEEAADSIGLYENGTVVEVLGVRGSYAHVRTQEGLCGYMPLQQLGGEPQSAVSAKILVLKDTPIYTDESKDAISDYAVSAGDTVAIYQRPAPCWERRYDYDNGTRGELFLAANDEWVYGSNAETWGRFPLDCLESPWAP